MATRHPQQYGVDGIAPYIAYGASPRGSINLVHAARAMALLRGRAYALPQDVQEVAKDVLRHRLVLTYQALAEEVSADALLTAVLTSMSAPRTDQDPDRPRRHCCARSTSSCAGGWRRCWPASTARTRWVSVRSSLRSAFTSRGTTCAGSTGT